MSKFKIGDVIETVERGRGFERARVLNIYTAKRGRRVGREMYFLKIICGTATIPVSAEVNYRLVEE